MADHMTHGNMPLMPVYGIEYPQELLDAMVNAALQEMRWRLEDYKGQPASQVAERQIEDVPRYTMPRYKDVLGAYWVACYIDPIKHDIVISLLRHEDFMSAVEQAKTLDDAANRFVQQYGLTKHRKVMYL